MALCVSAPSACSFTPSIARHTRRMPAAHEVDYGLRGNRCFRYFRRQHQLLCALLPHAVDLATLPATARRTSCVPVCVYLRFSLGSISAPTLSFSATRAASRAPRAFILDFFLDFLDGAPCQLHAIACLHVCSAGHLRFCTLLSTAPLGCCFP